MKCEQAEMMMAELLAGEIRPGDREALERHLLDCATCRADFELARSGFRLDWPEVAVPKELVDSTLASFRQPSGLVRLLRAATAAAAALSVALLMAVSGKSPKPAVPVVVTVPRQPMLASMQDAVVGAMVCKDEEGRPVGELGLKQHLVSVEILDGVAKTTVEENFENHTGRRLEGTFHFPLPPDASISRLALEVNGKIEEGTCLERERAREVFEGIVRKMQDPALLEWMPGGMFKCRVFPIEPRSTKRVIVAYTQALPFFRGKMSYVYPLASEKTKAHPPEEVRIDVQAKFSGRLTKIESTSHRVDVQRRSPGEARMTFRAANYRPSNDFVLALETSDEELRVVPHKVDGDDGYFACFFTPSGEAERKPGRYTFVLDCSASVSAPELEVEKRLVRGMMANRIEGDRFEVIAHNIDIESSGEVDLRAANTFMDKLQPIGGCDVLKALRAAPEGEVIYIGEGTPTFGETEPAKILEAVKGKRIRTIAVGSDANLTLLEKLGGLMRVSPNDDVNKRVTEIAATLGSPMISEIRLDGGDVLYDVVGARDVFRGERLLLTGRYRGQSGRLVVTGTGYRSEIDVAFPAKEEANNYVRRLWAQRKVSDLMAQRDKKDEITVLGVRHQIMTPYTSFLVLETEQMWKDHQLQRTVQKQDQVLGKQVMQEAESAGQDPVFQPLVTQKMAHLLELAYMAVDQQKYDRTLKLCEELLAIDPNYAVAKELKDGAQKARHGAGLESLGRRVQGWKAQTNDDALPRIPKSETVRFPSREEWAEVSKRLNEAVIKTEGGVGAEEDPDVLSVNRKLDTMKIDLAFENTKLEDILAFIRDFSGLNILLDAAVRDKVEPDKPMTFKVQDLVVKDVLKLLLAQRGLDYTVTPERVVLLTDPKKAGGGERDRILSQVDQRRELELLFGQAQMHFERRDFPQCVAATEKMLKINPVLNTVAEMRSVAQRMQHMKEGRDNLTGFTEEWKRKFEHGDLKSLDLESVVNQPDRSEWRERISKRQPKGIAELDEEVIAKRIELVPELKPEEPARRDPFQKGPPGGVEVPPPQPVVPDSGTLAKLRRESPKGAPVEMDPRANAIREAYEEQLRRERQEMTIAGRVSEEELRRELARQRIPPGPGFTTNESARVGQVELLHNFYLDNGVMNFPAFDDGGIGGIQAGGKRPSSGEFGWAGAGGAIQTHSGLYHDLGNRMSDSFWTLSVNGLYPDAGGEWSGYSALSTQGGVLDGNGLELRARSVIPQIYSIVNSVAVPGAPITDPLPVLIEEERMWSEPRRDPFARPMKIEQNNLPEVRKQLESLKEENVAKAGRITDLQREVDFYRALPRQLEGDQQVLVRQLETQLGQIQELTSKVEEHRGKLAKSLNEKSFASAELQYSRQLAERLQQDLAALEEKHVDMARGKKHLEEKMNALNQAGLNTSVAPKKPLEAKVTAVANEIGLVVISIGKDDGVLEGDEFTIYRGGDFRARIVIDRSDRKWSAGKVKLKKTDPSVGDDASNHVFVAAPRMGQAACMTDGRGTFAVKVLGADESRGTVVLEAGAKSGIAAQQIFTITRDGKFVALVGVQEVSDSRAECLVLRGWGAGRVLPGDRAEIVLNVQAYVMNLPKEVKLDLASRASQQAIRAKMELKR